MEERTKIKTRQAEGIASAKAQGKHLGRPKTSITTEFKQAYKEWKAGNITAVKAMKKSNMTKATFYRKVKDMKQAKETPDRGVSFLLVMIWGSYFPHFKGGG